MLVKRVASSAITAPWRKTTMRSQTENTSVRRWLMRMTRDALRLQGADEVEHVLDLAHRERRGRLVHDDELRVEGQRAGDRDRLLLAAGQLAGHLRRPI